MTAPVLAAVTRGPAPEYQAKIVELLEEHLEAAKRGEYEAALVIFEKADEEALVWANRGSKSISRLVGRIEILKAMVIAGGSEP